MSTNALSVSSRPQPVFNAIAGLVSFSIILLGQQMVSRAISLGIQKTTAIWIVVPLGEILAVAWLFAYLYSTGQSIIAHFGENSSLGRTSCLLSAS